MHSKIDLINREGEAIEEAVAWHTVGIVADDGQSIGTGSAILWRQHSLILTANHVIEKCPDDDIWFYFRDEGTMKRSPIDELPKRRDIEYKPKVKTKIVGRFCAENSDLAALEVQRSVEGEHSIRFFELAQDAVTPQSGTVITMRGYPSAQARVVAPGTAAAFALIQWSRIHEKPNFEPFDPSIEFLTPFVAANKGMHARGFSGAGVWFDRPTDGVWHPNLGLAGVCTAYFSRRKLLSIVRIEQITRFLNDIFPK
jgi:hypothetical protein